MSEDDQNDSADAFRFCTETGSIMSDCCDRELKL